MDAVDELIAHRRQFGPISPMLERVYRFHKSNHQVLDFLVSEMWVVRENGWTRTSLGSLWHYARWVLTRKTRVPGESFAMNSNLSPWYARIIAILHPDLVGLFEMYASRADEDFGTTLGPTTKGELRRLTWEDGTPLDRGWRPTIPHEPMPVHRRERVRRDGEN